MDNALQGPDAELDYTPALVEEIIRDKGQVDFKGILIYKKDDFQLPIGELVDPGKPHCRVWVRFHESIGWRSYLRIRVFLREADKDEDTITLKFGVNCIQQQDIKAEQVTGLPVELSTVPRVDELITQGLLHKLTFAYSATTLATEGLKSNYEGDAELQNILINLRQLLTTGNLTLYVRSADDMAPTVRSFVNRLQEESGNSPVNLWHTKHPEKQYVQLGQLTDVADRPNISVAAELTFGGIGEYVTIQAYGAIIENEVEEERANAISGGTFLVRLLEIAGAGDRRYMGIMEVPAEKSINEGDSLALNFNLDVDDRDEDWSATVLPNLLYTRLGQVTLVVRRKYNRITETFVTTPVTSITVETANADMKAAVTAGPTNRVTVQMTTDSQTLKRQVKAVRTFQDERLDLSPLICYGRADLARSLNMYALIPADQLAGRLAKLTLNGTQQEALTYCCNLPGGIGLIQGPPGSGKTYWCSQVVQPLMYKDKKNQILIVTPTNKTTDELVDRIQDTASQSKDTAQAIIIRFHSLDSEKDVIWKNAKGARDPGPTIINMDVRTIQILQQLEAAKYVYDMFQESTYRPSIVDDVRMNLIEK